jgi:hypothetical protein
MIEHRFEIWVCLEDQMTERRVDGSALQLVIVCLSDDGAGEISDARASGSEPAPPVVYAPGEARELAFCLLELAEVGPNGARRPWMTRSDLFCNRRVAVRRVLRSSAALRGARPTRSTRRNPARFRGSRCMVRMLLGVAAHVEDVTPWSASPPVVLIVASPTREVIVGE